MRKKGISSIVLIITIVVIIILAAAIIVNLTQTNVINNASEATVKQDFKTLQEELSLYIADKYANTLGKYDVTTLDADKTTTPSVYEVLKLLEKTKYKDDVTVVDGKIVISDSMSEPEKTWAMEALNCVNTSTSTPTEPEETEYPKIALNVIVEGENATINGKNPEIENPVIPIGFMAVNEGASWEDNDNDGNPDGWNDGLVIQDESENEFVWVPCTLNDGTNYVRYSRRFDEYSKVSSISSVADDTDAIPVDDETAQIAKYGGFYIGKYETGVPANQTVIDGSSESTSNTTGIPTVKQGVNVWTNINYINVIANAKLLIDNDNIKSGLITGTQWDTVMKWIENAGTSVEECGTWGNYIDSSSPANVTGYSKIQVAGYSEYWSTKNIYDLAGNVWEWTAEKKVGDDSYRIIRSGDSECESGIGAAYRYADYYSTSYSDDGFRIVLYVI